MDSLLVLFYDVDDFCQLSLLTHLVQTAARSLTIREIMAILIAFHQSHYRDFKA